MPDPLVSLSDVRLAIKEETEKAILQHLGLCPFTGLKIEQRVRTIEGRFALLLGFMAGSGLLGGAMGGIIVKFFAG